MAEQRPDRTLGPGHDTFWEWCGKGELRLPECTNCGKLLWPVAATCDSCAGSEFSWQRLSGQGRVVSWCRFVQDYYRGQLAVPYDTILVELAEGPLFISNPQGFEEADCAPGLDVEVRFKACQDSAGSFALPVFARSDHDA